jgi:hypothetical protein
VPTRIVGTAFRLLQQNEKNSFRIKETCICALPGHRSTARRGEATEPRRRRARHHAGIAPRFQRIQETPANWAFHPCLKIGAQRIECGLTAFAPARRRLRAASRAAIFAMKKNLRTSLRKAIPSRVGDARGNAKRANRARPIRKTTGMDRFCKRLTPLGDGQRRGDSPPPRAANVPAQAARGARSWPARAIVRLRVRAWS